MRHIRRYGRLAQPRPGGVISNTKWSLKCFLRTLAPQDTQRKTSSPPRLAVCSLNRRDGSCSQSSQQTPQYRHSTLAQNGYLKSQYCLNSFQSSSGSGASATGWDAWSLRTWALARSQSVGESCTPRRVPLASYMYKMSCIAAPVYFSNAPPSGLLLLLGKMPAPHLFVKE